MSTDHIEEARRQVEVCNACRYCEGFCSVFPAISRERHFSSGDIIQLANLCHNCRGCYYACQYTDPHEFSLNIPLTLAKVRQQSWQDLAFPTSFAGLFHRSGVAIVSAMVLGFAVILWGMNTLESNNEASAFYAVLSHNVMVAIFAPAFIIPFVSISISLRRYWHRVGADSLTFPTIMQACKSAASLRNLAGGHGDGCNFEDEDRFTHKRRVLHQITMYGFLLCFAATSCATVLHYVFGLQAPYSLFSLPKLLGVSGGCLLSVGTAGLAWLKLNADRELSDVQVFGGEMAFILLLLIVSTSGLALYAFGSSGALPSLLAIHLGSVLTFFILMPFSKMAHGFYRMASLARDAQLR